jgi:hypothetical protein
MRNDLTGGMIAITFFYRLIGERRSTDRMINFSNGNDLLSFSIFQSFNQME